MHLPTSLVIFFPFLTHLYLFLLFSFLSSFFPLLTFSSSFPFLCLQYCLPSIFPFIFSTFTLFWPSHILDYNQFSKYWQCLYLIIALLQCTMKFCTNVIILVKFNIPICSFIACAIFKKIYLLFERKRTRRGKGKGRECSSRLPAEREARGGGAGLHPRTLRSPPEPSPRVQWSIDGVTQVPLLPVLLISYNRNYYQCHKVFSLYILFKSFV